MVVTDQRSALARLGNANRSTVRKVAGTYGFSHAVFRTGSRTVCDYGTVSLTSNVERAKTPVLRNSRYTLPFPAASCPQLSIISSKGLPKDQYSYSSHQCCARLNILLPQTES